MSPLFRNTLHLILGQNTKNNEGPPDPKARLTMGDYIVDIIEDERASVHHWIVQKLGSAEVIFWGQERTVEAARREAQAFLEQESRRDQRKQIPLRETA